MNKKDNSGRPWDILLTIMIIFAVLVMFLMLFGSTGCKQDNRNNDEWQEKLDSIADHCDSLQVIINDSLIYSDTLVFYDTSTIIIYDTLLFWKQYIGDVQFEQVGYYYHDSSQHVYFKVRNFDTIFHSDIYVDIWQGDSIRLRKDHAFEGLNPNESFHRKYISRFATDTTDYTFILYENDMPTDTAVVSWNSHSFELKKVNDVKFEDFE